MGAAKCPRFGFATWSAQVGALEDLFWGPHRGKSRGGVLKAVRPLGLKECLTLEQGATSRPVGRGTGLGYTLGMGAAKAVRPLSLEEYLALEREAPTP
jgi:hypothetical protein